MNILHLLSQNHLTGAEVYAVTLANEHRKNGHLIYQMSNGFYYPSENIKLQLEVETRSKIKFIKNVLWLRNFIRKQNIHVIHTHSRAAAKLAYWSTLFSDTGVVSTVHGVQHSSFSKKLHNQYGQFIVAVCENIKKHLIKDFSYNPNRIHTVPNPINAEAYYFKAPAASSTLNIAIVGRTTGPKGARTQQAVEALFSAPLKDTSFNLTLIGGRLSDLSLPDSIKSMIQQESPASLNSEIYSKYNLVIGSGRVCMESLITGINTIAFGEASYVGLITPANYRNATESNFGDIHPSSKNPQINTEDFVASIKALSSGAASDAAQLSQMAQQSFSLKDIAAKVQRTYESAYFLKNYSRWIPVLMYHKIPDQEIQSQHKIYVTKSNFEKHLKFFKSRNFTTLTFSDLKKFRTGEVSFSEFPKKPLILTFDDGYRDNLKNASPLLKQYGFRAQLFLLADQNIDQNSWDVNSTEPAHEIVSGKDRQQWLKSQFEVGSHGFEHKKITEFNEDEALKELIDSKKSLEQEFSKPINVYAFTYGVTGSNSDDLAQAAGYDYAVNTDTGGLILEENPYSIFRVNIFPDESSWSLFKKTSAWYRKYYYWKRKK
ncbi:polysaccharide deacetylase family protein [bacterium]|nr:polysaccharide deacetylase family protein [bacterium]